MVFRADKHSVQEGSTVCTTACCVALGLVYRTVHWLATTHLTLTAVVRPSLNKHFRPPTLNQARAAIARRSFDEGCCHTDNWYLSFLRSLTGLVSRLSV